MPEDIKKEAEATIQVSANEEIVETDVKKLQEALKKAVDDVKYWKGEAKESFSTRNDAVHKAKEKELELIKVQEAELLKIKDYDTLKKKVTDREQELEKQQESLKTKIMNLTLRQLASEAKIKKPDYIDLMKVEVEVDDELNVKNIDSIKKKIEDFKKENLDLFNIEEKKDEKITDKRQIPIVDKKGPGAVSPKLNMSPRDIMLEAIKARGGK